MKKSVLLSALVLTAAASADGDVIAASQSMSGQSKKDMSMKNNDTMMNMVTLTSARPESDNGWYLFADALYWHASVGNADWAERTATASGSSSFRDYHLDFKWSWGFKAGIGVNMDHDMWDSNVYFTWFQTQNSNSVGLLESAPVGTTENISTFVPPTDDVVSGKHRWKIRFGMFDWELGRWQYSSKMLALRPHVGLKGGWINQTRKTSLSFDPTISDRRDSGKFINDFWGIGPSVGVNTMWVLGNAGNSMEHRFCLFGDAAGALMYGHFHNSYSVNSTTAGVTTSQKVKNLDRNLATSMLQAMMGFSWDTAFNRDRSHFTFKVGYEFQYWFRQNQFLSLKEHPTDNLLGAARYSDDLALQGVTGEFRFDF